MNSRCFAALVLGFAGLLGGASLIGIADRPPEISSDQKLPSIVPYVGSRVTIIGTLICRDNGTVCLGNPDHHGWDGGAIPWFADSLDEIRLAGIPSSVVEYQTATVTGTLSAAPSGSTGLWRYVPTLVVDAVHCESYNTPVWYKPRESLDSASGGILLLLLIASPLWLRLFILLLPQRSSRPESHDCPCCGYDCRGSPLRCPECGSPVQVPNTRLDLNPNAAVIRR